MDPGEKPFILDDFKNLVQSYGISIEVKSDEMWRYFAIFDKNTVAGAFTADII